MKFLFSLAFIFSTATISLFAISPKQIINFGELPFKALRDTTIYISSQGSAPLLIQKVDIKCVCTKVEWPRSPIMVGDSAAIKVTFKAQERGVFYKTIYISTSQSSKPLEIIVRGAVK